MNNDYYESGASPSDLKSAKIELVQKKNGRYVIKLSDDQNKDVIKIQYDVVDFFSCLKTFLQTDDTQHSIPHEPSWSFIRKYREKSTQFVAYFIIQICGKVAHAYTFTRKYLYQFLEENQQKFTKVDALSLMLKSIKKDRTEFTLFLHGFFESMKPIYPKEKSGKFALFVPGSDKHQSINNCFFFRPPVEARVTIVNYQLKKPKIGSIFFSYVANPLELFTSCGFSQPEYSLTFNDPLFCYDIFERGYMRKCCWIVADAIELSNLDSSIYRKSINDIQTMFKNYIKVDVDVEKNVVMLSTCFASSQGEGEGKGGKSCEYLIHMLCGFHGIKISLIFIDDGYEFLLKK